MTWLDDLWWDDDRRRAMALLPALAAAETLFRAGVALRSALHASGLAKPDEARAAVVSVGNLVVGGAGKTPVAIAIAGRLQARGRRVAVLSRGYRAARSADRVVSDGARLLLSAAEAGDEPFLIARRLTGVAVLCGPRRAPLAARAVVELGSDAIVLDDGFQHRALRRDLDVVVIDAARPAGNGRLLPRGPNREPWSALRRAQLAWIAGAERIEPSALDGLRRSVRDATGGDPVIARQAVTDVRDGTLERSHGRDALQGRRVLMACAVARPERFRATLAGLGAEVVTARTFRDHHRFADTELEALLRSARDARCDVIAITEKDAVRLAPRFAGDPLWHAVRIEAQVLEGEGVLEAWLGRALAAGDARLGVETGTGMSPPAARGP